MAKPPPPRLSAWLQALLPLGPVEARRMFGGWGLFCEGAMFALVIRDSLFFKTDADNRAAFEAAGSRPFVYTAKGRPVTIAYWLCPEPGPEDRETLLHYAGLGLAAARRAARAKTRRAGRAPG